MYIQYKEKSDRDKLWWGFGGRINPGRNYGMFGILAGVRDHNAPNGFMPKGIPDHISYQCENDLYLYIDDTEKSKGYCTLEEANRTPYKVLHPDWHSHSWMTIPELKRAYKYYKQHSKYSVPVEYKAVLKAMEALEDKNKNDVIVVFWFDN